MYHLSFSLLIAIIFIIDMIIIIDIIIIVDIIIIILLSLWSNRQKAQPTIIIIINILLSLYYYQCFFQARVLFKFIRPPILPRFRLRDV